MRHQTPADLKAEEEIAAFVTEALGLIDAPKLPHHYVLDRVAIRETGITAFFEVKDRNIKFGVGDGLYVSLMKVLKAHTIKTVTGLPCHLVARFPDGTVWWCPLESYDFERGKAGVFWFGPADRDEREPHVAYPWDILREIRKDAQATAPAAPA